MLLPARDHPLDGVENGLDGCLEELLIAREFGRRGDHVRELLGHLTLAAEPAASSTFDMPSRDSIARPQDLGARGTCQAGRVTMHPHPGPPPKPTSPPVGPAAAIALTALVVGLVPAVGAHAADTSVTVDLATAALGGTLILLPHHLWGADSPPASPSPATTASGPSSTTSSTGSSPMMRPEFSGAGMLDTC